jgi:hypothetical protein
MPFITVCLDRVFDVSHQSNSGAHGVTWFSFEFQGQRHFGVRLPGRPVLHDGMIVTAYLERENDWQTLRGWHDHATGEVISWPPFLQLAGMPFAFFMLAGSWQVLDSAPIASVLLALAGFALAFVIIRDVLRNKKVAEDLRNPHP